MILYWLPGHPLPMDDRLLPLLYALLIACILELVALRITEHP